MSLIYFIIYQCTKNFKWFKVTGLNWRLLCIVSWGRVGDRLKQIRDKEETFMMFMCTIKFRISAATLQNSNVGGMLKLCCSCCCLPPRFISQQIFRVELGGTI